LKVLLSLFRFAPGTGRSSKFPPDRKYSRWQQLGSSVDNDVKDEKGFQAIAKI
jgi:hypothetical protein